MRINVKVNNVLIIFDKGLINNLKINKIILAESVCTVYVHTDTKLFFFSESYRTDTIDNDVFASVGISTSISQFVSLLMTLNYDVYSAKSGELIVNERISNNLSVSADGVPID